MPLFDGLGSERTVTNSSQTVTGTATYEGFGQTVATTGSSTDPYMFAATSGYRNDGDAGLMHVGARYYDAQVGRFISRDTFLDQKPYLYCEHDPVNGLDPTGHDPITDLLGGGGTIIGGFFTGGAGFGIGGGATSTVVTTATTRVLGIPIFSQTTSVATTVGPSAGFVTGGAALIVIGTAIACYAGYQASSNWVGTPAGQNTTNQLGNWMYKNTPSWVWK